MNSAGAAGGEDEALGFELVPPPRRRGRRGHAVAVALVAVSSLGVAAIRVAAALVVAVGSRHRAEDRHGRSPARGGRGPPAAAAAAAAHLHVAAAAAAAAAAGCFGRGELGLELAIAALDRLHREARPAARAHGALARLRWRHRRGRSNHHARRWRRRCCSSSSSSSNSCCSGGGGRCHHRHLLLLGRGRGWCD